MIKYRIVQFNSGEYALEELGKFLWWEYGTDRYRDIVSSRKKFHWDKCDSYFNHCLTTDINVLKKLIEEPDKYGIKKVIVPSKLERALK